MSWCCPVVELRQYTLRAGQRDVLVELFDRALVEPQEADGMTIVGQFRDVDRPDRFVWIRGFPDMVQRRVALESFYGGPTWKEHSDAANATMVDVDDVLLLRPGVGPASTSGFAELPPRPGPGPGVDVPASPIVVTICPVDRPVEPAELDAEVLPALTAAADPPVLAAFVDNPAENTFPALPVRTGEPVVVWVQRSPDPDPTATLRTAAELARAAVPDLVAEPTHLHLAPTPRSRLR